MGTIYRHLLAPSSLEKVVASGLVGKIGNQYGLLTFRQRDATTKQLVAGDILRSFTFLQLKNLQVRNFQEVYTINTGIQVLFEVSDSGVNQICVSVLARFLPPYLAQDILVAYIRGVPKTL
ncbi:MAG: hypothetical protein QT08_C0017G0030 [archaeon GW2011_AR17]|nr:MAG: hypothetical protein QT08_C0017G0030 [archaeon GW2011_AR17]MBS3154378.1 hypothetical protein [Candidatus Woesearchaeota archaeon]HIH15411.1 hypothetical protein [Nanoarchaeota archaeon]HIH58921.1 hypothetical protein [Nanoarchaeota archaeon]HII13973.1 hypothetical protein [Nanoarchaeota archaeon]